MQGVGLGPLLGRMPGGLSQTVGETGWQLSHGEKSRLYLARALLQGAELVVLDESFAALDPESLRQTLSTTLERAPALIVIAHPWGRQKRLALLGELVGARDAVGTRFTWILSDLARVSRQL